MSRPRRRPPGGSGPGGQRQEAGGQRPQSLYTPGASGTRQSVERASARPLMYLRQLPRWLVPLAMILLLVAGFAVPGWGGAVALVLLAACLAWLGYLSWPALAGGGRLLRIAAIVCVLALAGWQAAR
jgi:hypothetical protein